MGVESNEDNGDDVALSASTATDLVPLEHDATKTQLIAPFAPLR